MGTLIGSLSSALSSLLAQQGAMEVTSNNIANANTPGYSRQVVHLAEIAPAAAGTILFGEGVKIDDIQTVRNEVLNLRIQQETQSQGQANSFLDGANQVQALFNETQGVGLQSDLSKFFTSLSQLSTDPTSSVLRQAVLSGAQNLAGAFNQASAALNQVKNDQDQVVMQTVNQVNQLTTQIAGLNDQVANLQATGADTGELQSQRDQAIQNLSNLIGVSATKASDGSITLTTGNGSALVVGKQSYALSTGLDAASGTQHVFSQRSNTSQGIDITASLNTPSLSGGQLGGAIQVRDVFVPQVLGQLDNLAAGLTSTFNAQHRAGSDLAGTQNINFFTPFVPSQAGSNAGAASQFGVAITDSSQIAASSDGSLGSNGNALALAAVQDQKAINGQSVTDYYAGLVSGLGSQVSSATGQQQAIGLVLNQLQTQQSSYSGVSLDEEATNLVKYQNAYDAAARVITTVNQMMQTAINMVS